jgi:hypothetical protein
MGRDFKFTVPLDNQYVIRSEGYDEVLGEEKRWLVLRGWASDTSIDKLNGKMSENCIIGMVKCVNEGSPSPVFRDVQSAKSATRLPVGIDVDHSEKWTDQIGRATVARAIYDVPVEMRQAGVEPPVMYVEFEVDLRKSHGRDLKVALDDGAQLGLSIFGQVKRGYKKTDPTTKRAIEHFDEVNLKKIAITSRPVNNVTWVEEIRRSMTGEQMEEITNQESATPEPTEVEEVVEAPVQDSAAETDAGDDTILDEAAPEGIREPAATEEVAPVAEEAVESGLAPDALADILGLGAVPPTTVAPAVVEEVAAPVLEETPVAETAPEPVVATTIEETPAPVAEATAEVAEVEAPVVERAEPTVEPVETVEYLSRSMFGEFETEVRDIVRGFTEALQKAEEVIGEQENVIRSMSERLTAMEKMLNEGMGRRGAVARSFGQEEREQVVLGQELEKEQRERIMKELVMSGQGHVAAAMMMGWLKAPGKINDPLLPGNSEPNPAAQAAVIDAQSHTTAAVNTEAATTSEDNPFIS